jgi:hypothetical protein
MKRGSAISLSMLDLITNALGMFLVQMFIVSTFKPPLHRERVHGTIVVEGILENAEAACEVQLIRRLGGREVEVLDSAEAVGGGDIVGDWPDRVVRTHETVREVPMSMVYEEVDRPGHKVAVLRNPRPGDWEFKLLYADQLGYLRTRAPMPVEGILRGNAWLVGQDPVPLDANKQLEGTGDTVSRRAEVKVVHFVNDGVAVRH